MSGLGENWKAFISLKIIFYSTSTFLANVSSIDPFYAEKNPAVFLISLTCEKHCLLLCLARTHWHIEVWDMAFFIITLCGIVTHFAGWNVKFDSLKFILASWNKTIKREDQTFMRLVSSQSKSRSHCNVSTVFLWSSIKKITLAFSKLKSWLKTQKTTNIL